MLLFLWYLFKKSLPSSVFGGWQLAVGNWLLVVSNWQLAIG